MNLLGYNLFRNDRGLIYTESDKDVRGGGLLCYITSSLKVVNVFKSKITKIKEIEYLIVTVRLHNGNTLCICTIYRPPKGDSLADFFDFLNLKSTKSQITVVCGDVNYHLESVNTEAKNFKSLIKENNLKLIDSGVTFYRRGLRPSWLDIILVPHLSKVLKVEKSGSSFIAGHDYLYCEYNIIIEKPSYEFVYRKFENKNAFDFQSDIKKLSLAIKTLRCPDILVDTLTSGLLLILDKYAPLTRYNSKRAPKFWINSEIRQKMKIRDNTYQQYRKNGNYETLIQYRRLRNEITGIKRQSMYDRLKGKKDMKKLWSTLKSLGVIQNKRKLATEFLDSKELAEFFSDSHCKHSPCSLETLNSIITNYPINDETILFNFKIINTEDISKAISKTLKKCQGQSPDGLSLRYFSDYMHLLIDPLVQLFNSCLSSQYYPDLWKISKIIPLCKVPEPLLPSDSRPISNCCHLAKIFDGIICPQMMNHFETFNFFSKYQSGYRKHFSTQTSLLNLTDDIRFGIENKLVTILVMLDFSLAFNSLKLESIFVFCRTCGFSDEAMLFLYNYLSNRRFYIDNNTALYPLHSGIPQGTGPGPILYIGGTNSIEAAITRCLKKFFVDDDDLYLQCTVANLENSIRIINTDLMNIMAWAKTVGITVNIKKTKAMIFGSNYNLSKIDYASLLPVILNNTPLPFVNTAKNLGIYLSSDLTWNEHVTHIISNVHKSLHSLYRKAYYFPISVKITLVKQLIWPHFDYASLVYDSLTEYLDLKLKKLQNRTIRFIFGIKKHVHISPYRERLQWLTPSSRRQYFLGVQTFKILNSKKPEYLFEKLDFHKATYTRDLRQTSTSIFDLPLVNTASYAASFQITAMKLWNALPNDMIKIDSLNVFKKKIFKYLLDKK